MSPAGAGRGTRAEQSLRLWLRLISLYNLIDGDLRRNLKERFGCTLPQFDVLSELARAGRPLTMSELSRELMVSNGNITGLVDRLEREGQVRRELRTGDRRVQLISITDAGRTRFESMAAEHAAWLEAMFSALPRKALDQAVEDIHALRDQVRAHHDKDKKEP